MIESEQLQQVILDRFGILINVEYSVAAGDHSLTMTPDGIEPSQGFVSKFVIGLSSLTSEYKPGDYSANLTNSMRDATIE